MFSRLLTVLIIVICLFTRFYNLDWGNGYYFHPDENNMAVALSQFTPASLNPHFFAYGQFPLYLGYFTLNILHISNTFPSSIFILRIYSAIFSVLAIFIFYLIFKKLSKSAITIWLILPVILTPGLVQISHFGTTESLLSLVFLSNIYLGLLIVDKPKLKYILLSSLVSGIGLATKISSLIFIAPILLSLLLNLFSFKKYFSILAKSFTFIFLLLFFGLIFSPYNFLEFKDFLSSMSYETAVATGKIFVFYTTQFSKTIPYTFQFTHIFPYISGLPMLFFAIVGLIFLFKKHFNKYWFLILFPSLIYFLYFGQLYVKWTRFMSPLFFLFPLLTAFLISKIKSKSIQFLLLIICCLPGIYFMSLYFQPDVRLVASNWIVSNIPPNSPVLSESGNVVNLPIVDNNLRIDNYDFYNYQPLTLAESLSNSNYIIVPSRRVYKNYNYPYFDNLFNGSLGFIKIKEFTRNSNILLSSENAEETWSVFDQPSIRIYQKIKYLSIEEYEKLL